MPTVTVRGFLNFRTTVDGTVIVFTPSPSSSPSTKNVVPAPPIEPTRPPQEMVRQVAPTRPVQNYPTGLVTVLGGTVVQEGSTTVYETKVIGTYISGKYAQILSSTTRVKPREDVSTPVIIRPTRSFTETTVQPTRSYQHRPRLPHITTESPNVLQEANRREDEPIPNTINRVKKVHPLQTKAQKMMESAKARHLNARLHLNPLKSRWSKVTKGDAETTDSEKNKSIVKARKARLGTRKFALPARQSPRVWYIHMPYQTTMSSNTLFFGYF